MTYQQAQNRAQRLRQNGYVVIRFTRLMARTWVIEAYTPCGALVCDHGG